MSNIRRPALETRPRALFVSISFPPLPESQTIRNVYLLRGLIEAGWEVDVVTPAFTGGDPSVAQLLDGQVKIHHTRLPLFDSVMTRLSTKSLGPMLRYIRSAFAVMWGKVSVPDIRVDWVGPARRAVDRLCSVHQYSLLISSSGSNTAHRAVAVAAQKYRVPWLAEYGDPWALNPLPPASIPRIRLKNMKLESQALRFCSGMTVTTSATKRLYADWLKSECPLIEVVPCGFDEVLSRKYRKPDSNQILPELDFAYVGSASRSNRDLREIMLVLDQLGARSPERRLALRVVGTFSPFFLRMSSRLVHLRVTYSGWVPYDSSIREIGEASVLLLYGNRSAIQIPGKVYPYLASGRPIVYVAQLPLDKDPTWQLIRGFGGVVGLRQDDEAWVETLASCINRFTQWESEARVRCEDSRLAEYEWKALGARFAAFAGFLVKSSTRKSTQQ